MDISTACEWEAGDQPYAKGSGGYGQQQVEPESAVCPSSQKDQVYPGLQ